MSSNISHDQFLQSFLITVIILSQGLEPVVLRLANMHGKTLNHVFLPTVDVLRRCWLWCVCKLPPPSICQRWPATVKLMNADLIIERNYIIASSLVLTLDHLLQQASTSSRVMRFWPHTDRSLLRKVHRPI